MEGLNGNAKEIMIALKSVNDVEVTFGRGEITLYWENLRIDVKPKNFHTALSTISILQSLNARFE